MTVESNGRTEGKPTAKTGDRIDFKTSSAVTGPGGGEKKKRSAEQTGG